jgi:hypothetical protein
MTTGQRWHSTSNQRQGRPLTDVGNRWFDVECQRWPVVILLIGSTLARLIDSTLARRYNVLFPTLVQRRIKVVHDERAWPTDTILEEDHPTAILSKFGSNWATQRFQTRRFVCEFPIGSYVKLSSAVTLARLIDSTLARRYNVLFPTLVQRRIKVVHDVGLTSNANVDPSSFCSSQ